MTQSNLLVHGDASVFLRERVKDGAVRLCYVDPPFNVGASFAARTGPNELRGKKTKLSGPVAYSDQWGGIAGFLSFLAPFVEAAGRVLMPSGTLWLHLDHRAVHEAKALCDRVLGRDSFRGEVIWVPGNGARSKRGPSVTHQTLLVYSKSSDVLWNDDHPLLREPYADTSLKMHFRGVDDNGRRYRDRTIGAKTYRYYADEGRRLGSVWTDIPAMVANTPIRAEGTGYPTQKPEKLLERIIRLASRPGELVCDPMCGSGTTLVVAAKTGRVFAGSDSSALAIETATQRLRRAGVEFETGAAGTLGTIVAPPG